MSLRVLRCPRTSPLVLSLAFLFSLLSVSHADALVEYGGHGTGVRAVVADGQAQTIADTGELPAAGGTLSDSVATAAIPGLLGAGVIAANTAGAAGQTQTDASITDLAVALPGLAIDVDLLQSQALASCSGTTASVSGSSTIVGLLLNGTPIVANGTPNQTIALPLGLGQIVLNQQIALASGSVGTIEVNALRLQVPSLGIDVALGSSRAEISCDVQTSCTPPFLYSGRATVLDATVLGEHDVLVDTGPLPSQGGVLQSSLIVANLPLLSAATLAASTTGSAGQSASDATIANVALSVAGLGINADVVTSMAEAACTAGGPTASGDSVVLNLVIAGNVIPILGTPNQVVPLPLGLGHIVINEQLSTVNAGAAAIDVAALHVIVTGIADISIARTHADVTCVPLTRTFSGRGVIAQVTTTVPPLLNTIGDTGALPPQGGSLSSTLPNIALPGILSAGLVQSSTSGAGNQSTASTSLAGVGLLAGLVQANVIQSNATATCTGNTASVAGGSQIAGLTVAGLPIIISGAPNQVVPLIVGSLTINEQVGGAAGSSGDLTVNALHLTAAGIADVVLGSSHADIECDPDVLPPCPTPVAPTPSPTPTATPVGPTPSPSPSPTPGVGPTPTPTPVPTAQPTPTAPVGAPQPTANICHHNCPDKIQLRSGLDSISVKSGFPLTTQLNPANEGFRLVLRNANGIIYQATLLPGDLRPRGKKFLFTDKGARNGTGIRGGLSRVEVSSAGGGVGTRVNVEAFGDLSAATLSTMTVEITVGNDTIGYTQPWEQKPYGWYLMHR